MMTRYAVRVRRVPTSSTPHQAAVAFDIGCEDRRQLSFDGVRLPRFGTSLIEYSPTEARDPRACKPF